MEENYQGNPDSDGLGWYGNDSISIGCVDEATAPDPRRFMASCLPGTN